MKITNTFTIIIPADLSSTARAVAAAMWVDMGDDKAFNLKAQDAQGKQFVATHCGCVASFEASLPYLQANPAMLRATMAAVLPVDWPDIPVPTIAETEQFCTAMKLQIGGSFESALEAFDMVRIEF